MSVATFKMGFYLTSFEIISKVIFFNVGHFGLQIAVLMGKITDGSCSISNWHTKINL